MAKVELPQEVINYFIKVLDREREFVGEKHLDNGFLVKRNRNRATITLDTGRNIYSAKLVFSDNKWKVIGSPSIWADIKDIMLMEKF